MSIQVKTLADNRSIGLDVAEIVSFPPLEGSAGEMEAELERAGGLFLNMVRECHALGRDANTAAELLWMTDEAEKQTFRSRIRLFCVVRRIDQKEAVQADLERLSGHFALAFSSRQFRVETGENVFTDFTRLIGGVHRDCLLAVVKSEKYAGASSSPYPYYYADMVPGGNTDNFASLVAAMSRCGGCCVSFQLFPAQWTPRERMCLNEAAAELGRLAGGVMTPRGLYRDPAAAEPRAVLAACLEHANSPLFLYNILVFGARADCVGLGGKIVSLLRSGKKRIMNPDFACLDLTAEKVDLPAQFIHYPWNINNKLVHAYRNRRLLARVPLAGMLHRLPYLVTAEEAAAFFRPPLREKTMAPLQANSAAGAGEQFDAAVVSEGNIIFGTLLSHETSNIAIGCPPDAFAKHALVVGTPGSGKTTFSFNLLLQFARRGIPFLAIEPTKTEYRAMIDAVPGVQIFTPGDNAASPFIINPFVPPGGVTVEQYVPSLAAAFKAAFSMPPPLDVIFPRAVRSCYSEHGWKDYSRAGDPDATPFGLHEFILAFKKIVADSDYGAEVKGNLQSAGVFRLMNLIEQNANIFDAIHTVPIEDMLRRPTILELNAIDNAEQKALIMALLLIGIGVHVKSNRPCGGGLKNVILLDEAHILLGGGAGRPDRDGADPLGSAVKSLQDMIAEIRAYGVGIVVADQSPTKVSREVVANTDIKIAFRLVQSAEKELIADSSNMDGDAVRRLSRLKPGEAYVYYSRLENPQLILTEDVRGKEGIRQGVPNAEIAGRSTYWADRKALLKPFAECVYGGVCADGCDFTLRAQADYYANRMLASCRGRIKDANALKVHMLGVPKYLGGAVRGLEGGKKAKMVKCAAVRFMRKTRLETSAGISRAEARQIFAVLEERNHG